MKKTITILACFIITATIYASINTTITKPFERINIKGNFSVELIQSDSNYVKVIPNNIKIDDVYIEVRNNTLAISHKPFLKRNFDVKVILYFKEELLSINASIGAKVFNLKEFSFDQLDVSISSGASSDLIISCNKAKLNASSGSTLKIKGKSKEMKAYANTGGVIYAKSFICNNINSVNVNTGSKADVFSKGKVQGKALAGGHINVYGQSDDIKISKKFGGSYTSY